MFLFQLEHLVDKMLLFKSIVIRNVQFSSLEAKNVPFTKKNPYRPERETLHLTKEATEVQKEQF